MSQASNAKSAKARATILRNIFVNNRTGNFGRNLDDCLEMNDGAQVVAECIKRLEWDLDFCLAMLKHERHGIPAITDAIKQKYNPAHLRALEFIEWAEPKPNHKPITERIEWHKQNPS
jgi:hypothetical protein